MMSSMQKDEALIRQAMLCAMARGSNFTIKELPTNFTKFLQRIFRQAENRSPSGGPTNRLIKGGTMKYFTYGLVVISLLNLAELLAQTTISGPISGTWDTSGSPYLVIDNCVVPTNQRLVIMPGVKVVIGQNLRITVNGWIEALGTSTNRIQFVAPNDTVYWDKMVVNYSTSGVTKFRYCDFINSGTALHLLNNAHTNEAMKNEVQNCVFRNCTQSGIQVEAVGTFRSNGMLPPSAFRPYASPIISNNVFDATTDGITLYIQGSRWQHTMGYWYTYGNASPIIAGNVFKNLSGSALGMTKGNITENASFPVFVNNTLWEVSSGVFAQAPYDAIVKNNIFANTEIGVKREGALTSSVTHNCFYEKNSNNFVGFPSSYGTIVMNNNNGTPSDIGFNIFLDPQFVNGQDLYLPQSSPCIDAGTRDSTTFFLPDFDIAGNSRIFDGNGDGSSVVDLGAYEYSSPTNITEKRERLNMPSELALFQNFPNPFNPETAILYELPQTSQVEVAIFNLLGERIRTLVNERQAAGQHRLHWDGRNEFGRQVPSGVYLYRLRAGEFVQTRKMILMQ